MVAESIVIFAPMLQFGCASACSRVMPRISSIFLPKNGPPEAVSRILSIGLPFAACTHWKIAECSESTGRMRTPYCFAALITRPPAHTSVSLFASAMSLPALMAAIVGSRPTMPTTAVTTMSAPLSAAQAIRPSMPVKTSIFVSASLIFSAFAAFSSIAQTIFGCRARACSSNKFMRRLVVNATTSASIEGRISTVCVPIEPVEPKIAIFFIIFLLLNDLDNGELKMENGELWNRPAGGIKSSRSARYIHFPFSILHSQFTSPDNTEQ